MSRALVEPVYVAGRFYAAGVVPPDEVAELITSPRAWGESGSTGQVPATPANGGGSQEPTAFDPAEESVDEVNNYLSDADPDEVKRVLAAEATGKNRKGIVEGPYAEVD